MLTRRIGRLAPLALVPLSVLAPRLGAGPVLVFLLAGLAIVPLADWIRRATEQLAATAGSAIGGLLNVTFGNAAELILALFILARGSAGVVKATITGSIVGNSLLGLGLAILVGGWSRERQRFGRERAGLLSSLMILSVVALMVPALFDVTERRLQTGSTAGQLDEQLSLCVSVVLLLVFAGDEPEEGSDHWPLSRSLLVLAAATGAVALEAELVSGALERTAGALGLTTFFLGVMVLPLVGNAAEYFAAIYFARRDRMDLVMTIAVGSSIQIALFTAPLLVLVSWAMGRPMNLVFANPLELIAIAGVAFAVNAIAQDGETTWFEGVLLLAVYALLGLAFFFVR
jgi:Ca2+:H+ antiporter